MEEKNITEKESLDIISQMIEKTRSNVMGGNTFIVLGLLLAAFSLLSGVLIVSISSTWTFYVGMCVLLIWNVLTWYCVHRAIKKGRNILSYTDKALMAIWDNVCVVGLMVVSVITIMSLFPDTDSLDRMWVVPLSEIILLFVASMISRSVLNLKFTSLAGVPGGLIPAMWIFLQEKPNALDTGWFMILLAIYTCFTVVALGISLNDKNARGALQK